MLKFIADMNVGMPVVAGLRERGYDAVHVREVLPITAADEEILELAVSECRVVLTVDHDFSDLLFLKSLSKPSVILFRMQRPRSELVLKKLDVILRTLVADLATGAIVIAEDIRIRVHPLPVGKE